MTFGHSIAVIATIQPDASRFGGGIEAHDSEAIGTGGLGGVGEQLDQNGLEERPSQGDRGKHAGQMDLQRGNASGDENGRFLGHLGGIQVRAGRAGTKEPAEVGEPPCPAIGTGREVADPFEEHSTIVVESILLFSEHVNIAQQRTKGVGQLVPDERLGTGDEQAETVQLSLGGLPLLREPEVEDEFHAQGSSRQ